jgi:DNA-directed RNA polymerase specialized sigma24 family protein
MVWMGRRNRLPDTEAFLHAKAASKRKPLPHAEANAWEWVEQVRGGNHRAFDAVMARYKRPVLNFAYRMIGDATEAEDVAQDVFVRAYHSMLKPGFRRTTAEFSTWLFQVTRNAALDCLRRRKRRPARAGQGLS